LFAVALTGVWFLKQSEANSTASIAAQTERSNANLKARLTPAGGAPGVVPGAAERNKVAAQATKGEIAWSTVLAGVANSMPADVYLTSFQGTAGSAKTLPTVSVNARGRNYGSAASWVDALGQSPLVAALWVPSTNASGDSDSVTFTSTFQLTPKAYSARQVTLADLAAGRSTAPKPAPKPVSAPPTTTTSGQTP
jgi:hypothetical protein